MTQLTEDNLIDSPSGISPPSFTLKILFGPMFGCELSLPADDYFIIIHPSLTSTLPGQRIRQEFEHTASFAQNALYIPSDDVSPNLVLRLRHKVEKEQSIGYLVEIHDTNGSDTAVVEENTLFCRENICLAFKESSAIWSDVVTGYNRSSLPPNEEIATERITAFNRHKRRVILSTSLVLMLLMGSAGGAWYKHYREENRVIALNASLAGSPSPLKIVRASNNTLYVFGDGYQEMVWLREVLYKLNDPQSAIPIWTAQAKKQIVKNAQRKGYPVLQLDLSTPQHPQLLTYERLPPSQQEALKQTLHQEMPYAENINIVYQSKETLLKHAQQGLERLHIPYRQVNTDNGYALIVRDALSDNTLTTLKRFITDYYNQWGNQIINFSINLDENWLQDKSYLDAKGGYLFLNPQHWYFPVQQMPQTLSQLKGDA